MIDALRWVSRRGFLASAGSAAAALTAPAKPTVAAIVTEYRLLSHADVIVGRILEGYSSAGVLTAPRTRILSMYTDQVPAKDMSRALASQYGFHIYPTIASALMLDGDRLAVDAVLFVGEHGNYPDNDRGQKMYPRYELFRQIVDVMRQSGRVAPLFSDKHLSYSAEKALEMYRWTRELNIPFMAGSSIPVTIRKPALEIRAGAIIRHAVGLGYGDPDAYGFHTFEALQSMVERRRGAETGIASVEWLEGDAVWRWRDGPGRWSAPLLEAALATGKTRPGRPEQNVAKPVAFLLKYRDGFEAACYMLDGHVSEFEFAATLEHRSAPVATRFVTELPDRKLPHFDALVHVIEEFFVTGRPLYPVERTVLVSAALAKLFESRVKKAPVETPELGISYRAPEHAYFEKASDEGATVPPVQHDIRLRPAR